MTRIPDALLLITRRRWVGSRRWHWEIVNLWAARKMADRCCHYCNDEGDCPRCSYFFQRNEVHRACGLKWGDHEVQIDPNGHYPPAAICRPRTVRNDGGES